MTDEQKDHSYARHSRNSRTAPGQGVTAMSAAHWYPVSFNRERYEIARGTGNFLPSFQIALRNGVIVRIGRGRYRFRLPKDGQ
jgi:hypothetical protein